MKRLRLLYCMPGVSADQQSVGLTFESALRALFHVKDSRVAFLLELENEPGAPTVYHAWTGADADTRAYLGAAVEI